MPQLPQRSRSYGVGKEIGGAVYVHRLYEAALGPAVAAAKAHLPDDFDYTVVKYQARTGAVSFIASPDFDTAPEPAVGESIRVDAAGNVRRRRASADPEIYHHKWLLVADDYAGFDVAESQARSLQWTALPNLDRRRIGRQSYWQTYVVPRLS
jgi:hypothetical protein